MRFPVGRCSGDLGQGAVDPGTASVGQDVTFHQDVSVSADATLLVDFELWDGQAQKIWQTWHDNQPIHTGTMLSDAAVMTMPDTLPPGQYTLVSGVFSAERHTLGTTAPPR